MKHNVNMESEKVWNWYGKFGLLETLYIKQGRRSVHEINAWYFYRREK